MKSYPTNHATTEDLRKIFEKYFEIKEGRLGTFQLEPWERVETYGGIFKNSFEALSRNAK